jgi:ATP-dependent RNA helicase DDX3X
MTSATFPKGVRRLANEYLAQDFCRIRIGQTASAHKNIRQNVIWVDGDQKQQAVYDLLFEGGPVRTMIFCNSKMTVDKVDDFLYNRGLPTTSIHGDRNQREREDAMRAFRTGKAPILIATGISARGWDVKDCKHVINYDLPSAMHGGITEYIHRIGRTARIGNQGLATSFYNERDEELGKALVNVLVDCDCPVPGFLQEHVPEDGKVDFEDDTDDEDDAAAEGFGNSGGFGDSGDGCAAAATGWGGAPASGDAGAGADAGGFATDGGFTATDSGAAATDGW